ncbi:hypothetical protein K470DRAFT_33083 [Piedraia hortae CBS 480.64]|uniref:Uncharacterized protein n=1 Tax=Piedraia hortae CBS 480.64 TaxID=1314780 RepID=A0A6A7C271_9PEZI|nr:hypothetical protein K470DRAFT_33083 [Piedraia hortae CBS 480.64]
MPDTSVPPRERLGAMPFNQLQTGLHPPERPPDVLLEETSISPRHRTVQLHPSDIHPHPQQVIAPPTHQFLGLRRSFPQHEHDRPSRAKPPSKRPMNGCQENLHPLRNIQHREKEGNCSLSTAQNHPGRAEIVPAGNEGLSLPCWRMSLTLNS